jgi:hypothetical protein
MSIFNGLPGAAAGAHATNQQAAPQQGMGHVAQQFQQAMQPGGFPPQQQFQQGPGAVHAVQGGFPPQQQFQQPMQQQAVPQQQGFQQPAGNMFDGIQQAKVATQTNYIKQGTYVCKIDRVKQLQTRKNEDAVAIELTVCAVVDNNNGAGHSPAEEVTDFKKRSNDYFLGEMKQFVSKALKCDEADITAQHCQRICSPDQPLSGLLIYVKATTRTSDKGSVYTVVRYGDRVEPAQLYGMIGPDAWQKVLPDTPAPGAPAQQQPMQQQAPAMPQQQPTAMPGLPSMPL